MHRITSYALQYANVDFNAIYSSPYELFITEGDPLPKAGSVPAITDAQVAALVAEGRIVAGYVDLAVTDDNRGYWNAAWTSNGKDTGTLTTSAPSWLQGEPYAYLDSGRTQPFGYIVKYWDSAWQTIVVNQAKDLINRGYNAVFLDDVGRYYELAVTDGVLPSATAAQDMVQLIQAVSTAVKSINPNALVIVNGDVYLGGNAGGGHWSTDLTAAIDAMLLENYGSSYQSFAVSNILPYTQLLGLTSQTGGTGALTYWSEGIIPYISPTANYDALGGFTPKPGPYAHYANLNDFNGDAHSDILFRNNSTGGFSVWQVTGSSPSLHETANTAVGTVGVDWSIQGAIDFNGDGKSDIVWRSASTGQFSIWEGGGSSFVQNAYTSPSIASKYAIGALADFNGDGKDDLLFRDTSTGIFTLWTSTGSSFTQNSYVNTTVDMGWHLQAVGDFDGDGKADLLWRSAGGAIAEWQSTGSGFTANVYTNATVGTTWHIAAVADFNGDGKSDILWRSDSGAFSEWQSTGSGFTPNSYVSSALDSGWTLAGAFDFDGDGKVDLLWRNSGGTFAIWQSIGSGFIPYALTDASVSNSYVIANHHYDVV